MMRTLFFFFAAAVFACSGQEEKEKPLSLVDVFEPCTQPFITRSYNPDWTKVEGHNENTTFYPVLLSKGEAFRLAQQLYGVNEFETFKPEHLSTSCIRVTDRKELTGILETVQGFNDKKIVKHMNYMVGNPNSYYFPAPSPLGVGGKVLVSLSDNKLFNVLVTCHDDGLGSFMVVSPTQTLEPGKLDIAKEHLKALGFKEDNFVEPNTDLDCESPLEDIPVPKNLTVTLPLFFSNVLFSPSGPRFPSNVLFGVKK